jgi:hypothetical protein
LSLHKLTETLPHQLRFDASPRCHHSTHREAPPLFQ